MPYDFLAETYETERLKTLSVWSLFRDGDLPVRPHPGDRRGRSVREQMVHQCVSENLWFVKMLGIDVCAPPLPEREERALFLRRYAEDSRRRAAALRGRDDAWWDEEVPFFDVRRSRAWILVRRIAHTAHHRGQLTAMLRQLDRELYSTYGPSADTGGLAVHGAPTVYAYDGEEALLADLDAAGEGARRNPLPAPGGRPVTERPED
jgi:uncharacterized damage-inducible protein DinB